MNIFFVNGPAVGKYAVGVICGTVITVLLGLVIILGVSSSTKPVTSGKHGAIKLSVLPREPTVAVDAIYSTAEIVNIAKFEMVESLLSAPEMPAYKTKSLDLEINFAPQIAGTVALGGVPTLAVGTGFGGGAYTIGEVDELPYPLYAPSPVYPPAMRRIGKELKVVVRILLDSEGNVTAVEPVNKTVEATLFHQAAYKTIKTWRFTPCKKGGKAVSCVADQPITFTLNN